MSLTIKKHELRPYTDQFKPDWPLSLALPVWIPSSSFSSFLAFDPPQTRNQNLKNHHIKSNFETRNETVDWVFGAHNLSNELQIKISIGNWNIDTSVTNELEDGSNLTWKLLHIHRVNDRWIQFDLAFNLPTNN